MNLKQTLADSEPVPEGFMAIGPADHPRNGKSGLLIRNRKTGVFVLLVGGAAVSVPHKWAADQAAAVGKGTDAIQDICIARMETMSLNPSQVAEMVDGKISRAHVCDYLSRRSSIGSHKLQHLMDALGLKIG